MHTTAHPDDEHAGLLTYLSRGEGVRLALLTLNRGEAGANAIGSELFDALGMIRTEELRQSGRYYGLDDQYFTTVTDYGYSKTLEESLRNWGRDHVLRDMVRVLRLNRPLVVVSRFHGSTRDGHGNHQAAGGITPEAVAAAADPNRFPEQISEEGLQPWKVLRLYRGGVRESEPWDVQIDVGRYNPWIGDSYRNFGYYGLSLQRSQTGGRTRSGMGPSVRYYEQLAGDKPVGGKSRSFFEGMDTSLAGVYTLFGEEAPESLQPVLASIDTQVERAIENFSVSNPEQAIEPLVKGLEATRQALSMIPPDHEAAFILKVKEVQFEDAIRVALGLQVAAIGMPGGLKQSDSPWAPLPTMGAVVAGQRINIDFDIVNPTEIPINLKHVKLASSVGIESKEAPLGQDAVVGNHPVSFNFDLKIPDQAAYSRLYFSRPSVSENRYSVSDHSVLHTPVGMPALEVDVLFEIAGQTVGLKEKVYTREADVPYGYRLDPLKIAPRFVVNASGTQVVPLGQQPSSFNVQVEVVNNDPSSSGARGRLSLTHPEGWLIEPSEIPVSFASAGQQSMHSFKVTAQGLEARAYELTARLISDGVEYNEGYERVKQRELDVHYLYKPASITVHGMDVKIAADLNVGYVMGVGDEVPSAIEQLGADVSLLDEPALARTDLSAFDVIVVGTRAYAVRQDLLTYNQRLLDFAKGGGHLIVLYQTPEFVPNQMAAYPADLPRSPEEVSEEDSPVEILAPNHPVFQDPNKITTADFEGWIEQRGSKFFESWDSAYQPIIATYDRDQDPQAGGWLIADYGAGTYTYFAYAIHRQTPFAVPGAYRIFANLLSLYNSRPRTGD